MRKYLIFLFLAIACLLFGLPQALQGRYKFVFPMENDLYKVCDGEKWGVVDQFNNIVVSPNYHQVGEFYEDLIKVRQEIKEEKYWGFLDKRDSVVIRFLYREADDFNDGMARVRDEWKYGYIDKQGNPLIPLEFDLLTRPAQGIITYMKGKEVGILDLSGNRLTSAQYFPRGIRKVYLNGRYGFINPKGKIVVPIKYEKIQKLDRDFHSFLYKGKEGILVPYTNKIIVPSGIYDKILEFKNDFFYVSRNQKMGLIDTAGNIVVAPEDYDTIFDFTGMIAKVCKDEKYGVINREGSPVVPLIYDAITVQKSGYIRGVLDKSYYPVGENAQTYFSHKFISDSLSDLCVVVKDGKSGVLSVKSGQYLTSKRYDYVGTTLFEQDLVMISDNKKPRHFGFLNIRDGKQKIPIKFELLQKTFFDNIYLVREEGKMGLIFATNKAYRYVIKPETKELALVKIAPNFLRTKSEKGYGLVSEKGELFLEAKYDMVSPLLHGGAKVELGSLLGAVNKQGKLYVPLEYIYLEPYNDQGYLIAKKLYKFGVLDDRGRQAVPFRYDRIEPVTNGISDCMINGGHGFLDEKGKVRSAINYQSVLGLSGQIVRTQFAYNFGVVTKKGKEIIKPTLQAVVDREDGFILLTKEDKVALMDIKGNLLTPYIYQAIGKFREGYAIVKKEGRFGFINTKGEVKIPTIYNSVRNFVDGVSFVNLNGQPLRIDKDNKILD